MKQQLRSIGILVLILSVFVVGLTGGVMLDRLATVAAASSPSTGIGQPDTELLLQAWRIISTHYVDRSALEAKRLTYGAITGMVEALGDTGHSSFLSPEMLEQHHNYTNGAFEGIGAQVEKKGDYIVIVAPMDDSPAFKAGLKPGDIILKVNGQDMRSKTLEYAIDQVLGPAGSQVTLTIFDPKTETTREVTITRARIAVNNVSWARVPGTGIGVIRIMGFSDKVGDNLLKTLEEMRAQQISGIVLDLRNNPGGLLDEAVEAASQFLQAGEVLLQKDAQGKIEKIRVIEGGVATDLPLVVLINYGSASASEIVAGALQDAGRAQLIGETTYGTGTVLNTFGLSDGSALLLATSEWLTPQGRTIWHKGIAPDLTVALPTGAVMLTPSALKTLSEKDFQASRDLQLLRAVELLTCRYGDCAAGKVQMQ